MSRQTVGQKKDEQINIWTDRPMDKQTDGQTNIMVDRQTGRIQKNLITAKKVL